MHLFPAQDALEADSLIFFLFFLFLAIESLRVPGHSQMTFSVFERDHSINGTKDLWDGRLGVYGSHNHCLTCGAKKASDCEGMQFQTYICSNL
jgi:hypothetical protein